MAILLAAYVLMGPRRTVQPSKQPTHQYSITHTPTVHRPYLHVELGVFVIPTVANAAMGAAGDVLSLSL